VYLPVVESLYSINDVSHMGAVGLWQIMPERARYLGLKVNYWVDERRDPEKSTRAACRYLKELYTMFDDWYLALAAYNRGEFGLMRDMRSSNATDLEEMGKRKAMPRETELYVPQFLACVLIGNDPAAYGFSKVAFEPPLAYDKVTVHRAIDLRIVAQCAGTTVREILDLNPSIKSWCTPHNYPGFELCLPAGTRKKFMDNLVRVRELNPQMGYITYQVCKGEDMDVVARKFDTTADAILQDNGLTRDKTLAENQVLLVRPGKNYSGDTGN
jgi:membrane-bound lytic murein transglycosylase D